MNLSCVSLVLLLAAFMELGTSFVPARHAMRTTGAETKLFAQDRRSFVGTSASFGSILSLLPQAPQVANAALGKDNNNNNNEKIRIALWGYGNQNQLMAKYLADHEKDYEVVSVIGHHNIGEDYGTVESDSWGTIVGKKTGVKIVAEVDAPAEMIKTQPNVCMLCTLSTVSDLQDALTVCAQQKCNVITIAEELLNSKTSSPKLTQEMDELFQHNGVSLTGSGFIDGACCEMTMMLASMMHKIDGLKGGLQYNVDDYGTVLANAHGVGLTKKEFNKFAKQSAAKSYVYNSNEWFVSALGLTLGKTTEVRQPTFATSPLFSKSIEREISVGDATGMKVIATTTTKEGVVIVGEQVGKCYDEKSGDSDSVEWKFEGEPSGVSFRMDSPPTPQMTNTAAISRIPQIVNAPPGYITSDNLPRGKYITLK